MSSIIDMSDQEFNQLKNQYRQRIATIIIPVDISPGIAKGLLSRIDAFFSEASLELGELDGQMKRLDSLITEWERTKIAGGNDLERKKAASQALQNFPIGENQYINVYETYRVITERHSFLKAIIRSLEGKKDSLITINGLLKLEKDLSPYSNTE